MPGVCCHSLPPRPDLRYLKGQHLPSTPRDAHGDLCMGTRCWTLMLSSAAPRAGVRSSPPGQASSLGLWDLGPDCRPPACAPRLLGRCPFFPPGLLPILTDSPVPPHRPWPWPGASGGPRSSPAAHSLSEAFLCLQALPGGWRGLRPRPARPGQWCPTALLAPGRSPSSRHLPCLCGLFLIGHRCLRFSPQIPPSDLLLVTGLVPSFAHSPFARTVYVCLSNFLFPGSASTSVPAPQPRHELSSKLSPELPQTCLRSRSSLWGLSLGSPSSSLSVGCSRAALGLVLVPSALPRPLSGPPLPPLGCSPVPAAPRLLPSSPYPGQPPPLPDFCEGATVVTCYCRSSKP